MAGETRAYLKFGVIVTLVLAFAGGGNAQTRTEQALAADQAPPQSGPAEPAAAADGYQVCLGHATAAHDASWAAECKRISDRDRKDYDDCLGKLNLPKTYCDASYTIHDASPNCSLPPATASVLDAALERARYRCLQESKAVVQ